MSTTISAPQHRRLPLLASLSVVGVIAAAGVVGVAWHESSTSGNHGSQAPVQTSRSGGGENSRVAEQRLQQSNSGQQAGHGGSTSTAGGGKPVGGP